MITFPSLENFGPTRQTLQRYARAMSAIARVHGIIHPKWWHLSLKVTPSGLISDNMPIPSGGILAFRMDFQSDQIVAWNSSGWQQAFPMASGLSGTAMGDRLIAAAAENGLHGEYQRERFENDESGIYDRDAARRFFAALVSADRILKKHRARLPEDTGPVQLWPHGFDLAMEWFGGRLVPFEEDGEPKTIPAQINFGFYPGESDTSSYFYCNPWPFEAEKFLGQTLPAGAAWHTDGWQGTIMPYLELRNQVDAETRLLNFAQAVFNIASPILTAL